MREGLGLLAWLLAACLVAWALMLALDERTAYGGTPDTTDDRVSLAEARATPHGETRHHLRQRIGPVMELVDGCRPRDRCGYDYKTYRPRQYVWRVHYQRLREGGPLRVDWAAWLHCPEPDSCSPARLP